ncbi:hypothetical protein BGZ95_010705 [Linnemannia exigua]|uniref:Uncharacterized protein n=1 Tax=Linnemannia exigua TaxID=604196 RepID=A0AAD4H9D1_9FUNG|nr:hypothetical protein BGZ95_010705 [Linnemannia exigua]
MLPWRPLGMLTFGLTIIFLFVRLHGDGYDFPVQVVKCDNTLDFPKPSRTFLEISGVYHDDFWEWPEEQDQDGSIPIPVAPSSAATASSHVSSSSSSRGGVNHSQQQQQQQQRQAQGLKFGVGWNSQWHLGKKKLPAAGAQSGRREEDGTKERDRQFQNGQGEEENGFRNSEQWLWMTNVWLEDGDSGSGYLRQYRRRLDRVMASDINTCKNNVFHVCSIYSIRPQELDDTNILRILPEAPTETDEESQDEQQQHPPVMRGRESIRLAIVYKVLQEEHVSYHSRVYHFGTFQHHAELRDCEPLTTATCHRHAPFLNFDYVLPGSSPIKDFSLEFDMMYYSRLYDTFEFRSLKLPRLSEGATTPERPFTLTSGTPGPVTGNKDKAVQYRQSLLVKVPSVTGRDPQVLASITTETTEAMTGYKRWYSGFEWLHPFNLPYQETDYNDETTSFGGVPIQKPYFIKSVDGSSIHCPLAHMVASLELNRPAISHQQSQQGHGSHYRKEEGPGGPHQDVDSSSSSSPSSSAARPQRVGPGGVSYYEHQPQQHQQRQYDVSYSKQPPIGEPFQSNGAPKSRHWIISKVDVAALDVINTELGTVNDANNILALKTTLNSVVILRRGAVSSPRGYEYLPWRLSMILSDINYSSPEVDTRTREVIGMKILTMPAPRAPALASATDTESDAQAELQERAKTKNEDSHHQDSSTAGPEDDQVASPRLHNILFLVHGDGKILGYDLDQATESSSAMLFLQEKYLAVIGMLVVVATFVINEARYAIARP